MGASAPVVADLFCGCSGLGLGARNAGFRVATSIDLDPILTSSYTTNFRDGKLVLGDLSELHGDTLLASAGSRLDGIIGGPPCQGFSEMGRSDPNDPRRELLRHFFRIVAEARPSFFLMENVRGLTFPANRPHLEAALEQVSDRYEIVGPLRIDASEYGAATKRPRVFVFGYDRDQVDSFGEDDILAARRPAATVADAISDLKLATQDDDEDGFDVWRFGHGHELPSAYARRLRAPDGYTTGHCRTPHRPAITERFSMVPQGKIDPVGRHHRLSWQGQSPTIRAGTGPDKGSYQSVRPLHPDEPRVITVREAARLQGFPDRFRFHPTVWHSFRMIGNSVSPIVAEALLSVLYSKMAVVSVPEAAE
ncbi:MAG: DNA cytosine methyltransferase [Aurantimonas coralicida]|uniref:DNA cytosine methyltransferase n=1 Tax=Nisaea sp. TaxID=2024842 RepID=UPI0032657D55